MPPVTTLDQASFASFVASSIGVILRVVDGPDDEFPEVLRLYFDQEYPGAFQYAVFNRRLVKADAWWKKHFSNGVVVIPLFGKLGAEGYYLFFKSVPITHTTGLKGKDAATVAAIQGVTDLLNFAVNKDGAQFSRRQAARFEELGAVVANDLEGFLRFSKKNVELAEAIVAARPQRQPATPPPSAKRDPYEVLGVLQSAADEEVRKAYREKAKKNAPDKVAQMDLEFQVLANARLTEINDAWKAIKDARAL